MSIFCKNGIENVEVLAPNGNPSILFKTLVQLNNGNLDIALEQYLATQTDEFKAWFGNSKVLDINGEPLVVYHSTRAEFDKFSLGRRSHTPDSIPFDGHYFISDFYPAPHYGPKIIPTFLRMENPFDEINDVFKITEDPFKKSYDGIITREQHALSQIRAGDNTNYRKIRDEHGMDAISNAHYNNRRKIFIVKSNTQIKSIDNLGTFSSIDPNIYFQLKSSNFSTVDDYVYTEGADKKLRVSVLQQDFSSYARSRASRNIEDVANAIAKRVWRREGLREDEVLEVKIGNFKRVLETYTFEQYKEKVKKDEIVHQLEGKAIHYLYAAASERDAVRQREFEDLAEEYRVKAGLTKDEFDQYRMAFPIIEEKLDTKVTDVVHVEKTFSIDLDPFTYQDDKNNTITVRGYAGTVDRLVQHDDGTYTLTDFKTGKLHQYGDRLMNYAREAKIKFLDTPMNRNTINLAMYALMIRANNRNVKFRDINFIKVNDDTLVELISSGVKFDFGSAIKLLKEYFKDKHYSFYKQNVDLFNVSTYFATDTEIAQDLKTIMVNKGVKEDVARELLYKDTMAKFRDVIYQRNKLIAKGKELTDDERLKLVRADASYEALLEAIMEIKTGSNPFKAGQFSHMDQLQAWFSNRYGQSNPLIANVSRMYGQARQNVTDEFIPIKVQHDRYLKAVVDEYYKKHNKKLVGADYADLYEFMWEKGEKNLDIITYTSSRWNSLTDAQKKYADFYRWMIRFEMFKTLNPTSGITFIEYELKNRSYLSEEDRKFLLNQIEVLKKAPKVDKIKQQRLSVVPYYEGWTPKVFKTNEESKNVKELISKIWNSNFTPSDEELLDSYTDEGRENITGMPLRFVGGYDGKIVEQLERYTLNNEIIFNAFVSHIVTKNYMDDVYNIGIGVKHFMEQQDRFSGKRELNKFNIKFLDAFLKGIVLQQKTDSFNRTITVLGKNINIDHAIRSLRSYFGVTTLALNVLGAVGTGINQSLRTMTMATTGTVGNLTMGKNAVKDLDLGAASKAFRHILAWKYDQIHAKINRKPNSLVDNKIALFLSKFGYLPKSYDYYSPDQLKDLITKEGYIIPAWVNNDLLLKFYSSIDNINYAVYMVGQLHKLQTKKNGKLVSMWDAYDVVNGELIYTGDIRGIDGATGKEISEITTEEIDKLRAFSERDLGPYRADEKSAMDTSSLGAMYMMFKRWLPPLIKRAFSGEFENVTLGEWIQGKEIDEETGLPVMNWVPRTDEGFVTSLLKTLNIVRLAIISGKAGTFRTEWEKMTPIQKQNLIYAIMKIGSFIAIMLIIGAIFGDADEDDQNKIKRMLIRMQNETVFEFIVWDPEQWATTLVSAPPVEKLLKTLQGYELLLFQGVIPEILPGREPITVQSGPHEGWYKGTVDAIRGTKYVSTVFGFWELGESWESLDEDIKRLERVQ